jgi:tetratricopeptide (TPR) repeat protein
LEAASLSKEEFPPLIRPEDDLMEQRDLPALKTLLSSGDQFFMDVKEDLITYFYLTNIEKGDSYWMLPSREVRDALLCGQENRIRTQVEQIMSQTDDLAERKEINDIFIRRLKEVINQSSATNWDQRLSANYAITLFEINQNSNEEKVLLDAIQREPKDHRIRYRIGEMYNSQGHLEEASREFLEAFQLDPKNYQYKLASRQSKRELDDRIKEISTHYMRTLSKVEIDEARLVFGSGITYDPIRIHENANWPDAIAEIGSKLNGTPMIVANAITLGNHCYFPTILVT